MFTDKNNRILVIDDITDIHEDFKKILQPQDNLSNKELESMNSLLLKKSSKEGPSSKFQIDSAFQSQEGIDLVRKSLKENKPYAVAFVDVQMPPGNDGVETIQEIWKLDPEIQVVICTAYAKYSWEDLHNIFGETDQLFILKKPFDQIEIINLANTLTKRWSLNHSIKEKMSTLEKTTSKTPAKTETSTAEDNRLKEAVESLANINKKLENRKKLL